MTEQKKAPAKASNEQVERSHKLLKFVRRHRRMLTFIGALIVFSTFLTKEALREQLKDLIDSEKAAQQTSLSEVELSEANASYARIEQKIDAVRQLIIGNVAPADVPGSYDDVLALIHGRIERSEVFIRSMKRLQQELPKNAGLESGIEAAQVLTDNTKELYETCKKAGAYMYADPTVYGGHRLAPIKEAVTSSQKMKEFVASVMGMMVEHSEQVRARHEHRLSIYSWMSYGLYTLGWGLGLVGRLVGVNAGGDD